MQLSFSKYHGTGNDFILIDNRLHTFRDGDASLVRKLCHRRFSIGADGLILLQEKSGYDFEMVYFNSDGRPSSMCGNGGRCIAAFAARLGIIGTSADFLASDGPHHAKVDSYDASTHEAVVSLKMKNVDFIEHGDGYHFLDTGSPHYVTFVKDVKSLNVAAEGRKIRNSSRFVQEGTNVNFAQLKDDALHIRTYERGVEDETWSCGTGVTAAALVTALQAGRVDPVNVETPGGSLQVSFETEGTGFKNIVLKGKATFVFDGFVNI